MDLLEKAEFEQAALIHDSRAKGMAEGVRQARIDNAIRALKRGISIEDTAGITCLSIKKVTKLARAHPGTSS